MDLHIRYFDSMEHLEPKCHSCGQKLVYGVNTQYSEDEQTHVCTTCGSVV